MEILPFPADEDVVRRYVEELWIPYNRDLEATVEGFRLDDEVDLVDEETEFRLDLLESEDHRAWIAAEGADGGSGVEVLTDDDVDLVGFVTTEVEESPSVFDRPDRLVVGDIYVDDDHRGTGLARDLIDRAAWRAREAGCTEIRLDVDVANERAIAFYEKLGFETYRRQMSVPVDDL